MTSSDRPCSLSRCAMRQHEAIRAAAAGIRKSDIGHVGAVRQLPAPATMRDSSCSRLMNVSTSSRNWPPNSALALAASRTYAIRHRQRIQGGIHAAASPLHKSKCRDFPAPSSAGTASTFLRACCRANEIAYQQAHPEPSPSPVEPRSELPRRDSPSPLLSTRMHTSSATQPTIV